MLELYSPDYVLPDVNSSGQFMDLKCLSKLHYQRNKQTNITIIIVFERLDIKIESGFLLWLYQECIDVTTSYVQCLHTYLWLLQYSNCSNMNVMMHYN